MRAGATLELGDRAGVVGMRMAEQDQSQVLRGHATCLHVVQQVTGHLRHAAVKQHRTVGGLHQ